MLNTLSFNSVVINFSSLRWENFWIRDESGPGLEIQERPLSGWSNHSRNFEFFNPKLLLSDSSSKLSLNKPVEGTSRDVTPSKLSLVRNTKNVPDELLSRSLRFKEMSQ
jgi:hypothetical protein